MKARFTAVVTGETRLNVGFMHHCCMIFFSFKMKMKYTYRFTLSQITQHVSVCN